MPALKPVAQKQVSDRLRHDILQGALPFGSRLKIDELADRYATSHMPVREALRELGGEGLVTLEANRGARVRAIDVDQVRDIFDLRIAVEAMLARRAAVRITAAAILELAETETALEEHAARSDYDNVLQLNQKFHSIINEAAGNREAIRVLERHWNIIVALWGRFGYGSDRIAGVISDHRQIIVALSHHDAESAAILASAHAAKAKQAMLLHFESSAVRTS